ncbi:UNVERIFIED_CONTAM: Ras association domain-containing protein 7 [Gekko kuhli]
MELKVWVDGIQRVVCGVSNETTCQEIVIALARAIGQTGRYVLIQRLRDKERQLLPHECPVESSGQVRTVCQRRAVHPAAHRPQPRREAFFGECPPDT